MKFYKFHGTGNDFIMLDNLAGKITLSPQKVQKMTDRHFGIGADGVILVEKGRSDGDFFMNYWNSDGTLAEMCGNGTRCTAHFVRDILGFKSNLVNLETRGGLKKITIKPDNQFAVNMGIPDFEKFSDFPKHSKMFENVNFDFVSMGNPHAIGFFPDEQTATNFLNKTAPSMEIDRQHFPNRINISVVWKKGENHFGAKTHERGCGQTLACGTAMCGAFAVLTHILKKVDKQAKVQIDVPGGVLFFCFKADGAIEMTGPSKRVFEGIFFDWLNL